MPSKKPITPIRLYRFRLSGHCHRVELMLSILKLPYEFVELDRNQTVHKQADFLAKNPFGMLPVIEDGDVVLADSNAILVYLCMKYDDGTWLPRDALAAARVQRWLSVAAGELAYGPAKARAVVLFNAPFAAEEVKARSHDLLAILDSELKKAPYLAGASPTIADIANYSYIAMAPEGNVSLQAYAQVRAWLARIEALAGFVPAPFSAVGLRA